MTKKYYYFYKITNNLNNRYYYGVHSTNNLEDGYMGSEKAISAAIQKYGVQNFTKEILLFFNDKDSMYEYEKKIINREIVYSKQSYNLTCGGKGRGKIGYVVVRDKDGNIYVVSKTDPRYLSGELVHNTKRRAVVKDKDGNIFQISVDDPNYHNYTHINKGYTMVKGENNNFIRISVDDPNYHNYTHINKGYVMCKDKDGNIQRVYQTDDRLKTGELVGLTKGEITVYDKNGNKVKVKAGDPRFQTGELNGYRKNLVTVRDKKGNIFSINKNDPRYINKEVEAIYKGHVWIYKDNITKHVSLDELDIYIQDGWHRGRKLKSKEIK